MRRALIAALIAVSGLLAVHPAGASANGVQWAIDCTEWAYLRWNPLSPSSTATFANSMAGCGTRFTVAMADEQRRTDFIHCIDRAIEAYRPIRGIEGTGAIAIYCVETVLGYDIAIDPDPEGQQAKPAERRGQRRARRRVTRSHRLTRS